MVATVALPSESATFSGKHLHVQLAHVVHIFAKLNHLIALKLFLLDEVVLQAASPREELPCSR